MWTPALKEASLGLFIWQQPSQKAKIEITKSLEVQAGNATIISILLINVVIIHSITVISILLVKTRPDSRRKDIDSIPDGEN